MQKVVLSLRFHYQLTVASERQISSPYIAPTQILLEFQREISDFLGIVIEHANF